MMTIQDLSAEQITALVGTRHAVTGVEYPPGGLQPYYEWLVRTLHHLAESSAGALRVARSSASATAVVVSPGRASIGGVALAFEGETLELATFNNSTVLVWLEDLAGAAVIGHGASAGGWPGGLHIKLAEVTVAAGEVTAVLDRRFETILSA